MPRGKGSKNLPITGEKAIGRLAEIAKESGVSLNEYFRQLEELEAAGVSKNTNINDDNIQKMSSSLKANLFNQDNDNSDDNEDDNDDDNENENDDDTYECGVCHYVGKAEFTVCPKCEASGFSWE